MLLGTCRGGQQGTRSLGMAAGLGTDTQDRDPGSCCGCTRPQACTDFHQQDEAWGDTARPSPPGSPPVLHRQAQRGCPGAAIPRAGPRLRRACSVRRQRSNFSSPWAVAAALGTAGLEFSVGACGLDSEKHPTRRKEPLCRKILRSDVPFSCGCVFYHLHVAGRKRATGMPPAPYVPPRPPPTLECALQRPSHENRSLAPPLTNEASEALLRPGTLPTTPTPTPTPRPSHRPSLELREKSGAPKGRRGSPGPARALGASAAHQQEPQPLFKQFPVLAGRACSPLRGTPRGW